MMAAVARSLARGPVSGPVVAVFWVASYVVVRGLLGLDGHRTIALVPWARVALALVPALPAALFLWSVVAAIRSGDELQRRVHLEALAIAYPLAILLLMTLGLLQLAVPLPADDWSYRHIWVFLPMFYFLGVGFASRRYR